jgi:hypothetical protein
MVSGLACIQKLIRHIVELLEHGDWDRLEEQIGPVVTAASYMFGAANPDDAEYFAAVVFSLLKTGKLDMQSLLACEDMYHHLMHGDVEKVMEGSSRQTEEFLMGLVIHWVEKYGKPVFTTSFDERVPRLYGGLHLPFPSGERAALVLSKMVQYRDYLEKEGIYREEDFDAFTYTLFK